MSEPIFSVLTGKAQSCDSNGNCYYCGALFSADRIYGTFTVTGAGSVTYTDPDDANNPYNGTYDLNGTYSHIGGDYWGKDNFMLQIENLNMGQFTLAINVVSNADLINYGLGSYPSPNTGYDYLEWLWTANDMSVYDMQNNCSSQTLSSSLFSLNSDGPENGYYHPGITLSGGAPTVVWNPDNTNRTICNNAGGVYAGVWHSSYPGNGFPTSTVEECLIYTLVPDADGAGSGGECATPSSPGGTYTFVSKNSYPGDTTDWSVGGVGTCCSGDCVTPFTDCTSGVFGDWGGC